MKKAHLVVNSNTTLVNAKDVSYSNFSQIFQCPYCHEVLHLRSGYQKESGWVDPTFVHLEGNEADCEARAKQGSPSPTNVFDIIEKGQSNKKLEKAFLGCFENYFRGWYGSMICCDEGHKIKIPRYDYIYRWQLVLSPGELSRNYLKKIVEYNSRPDKAHKSPELLIQVLSQIIRDKKSDKFVEKLIADFENQLTNSKNPQEYLLKKAEMVDNSAYDFIKQHCVQLAGILDYLRFGSSERLRVDVLRLLLWGDYRDLPVSPTKIETKSYRAKRRSCMRYYIKKTEDLTPLTLKRNSLRRVNLLSVEDTVELLENSLNERFERRRRSQLDKIQKFDPNFLSEMTQSESMVETAFSEFYKQEVSLGSTFISFALRKLVISTQFIDWKKLPETYGFSSANLNIGYCGFDVMFRSAMIDIECPVVEFFSNK